MNTFRLTAGAIAILAAATSTGLAQQVPSKAKPFVAPQSATVTHPPGASTSTVVAPARNAIGLPAAGTAGAPIGASHGPGLGGSNISAAKPPPTPGVPGFHSVIPHAPAPPSAAKSTLSGTQMGRPATGAAMLGGNATHAPAAVIGRNVSTKH